MAIEDLEATSEEDSFTSETHETANLLKTRQSTDITKNNQEDDLVETDINNTESALISATIEEAPCPGVNGRANIIGLSTDLCDSGIESIANGDARERSPPAHAKDESSVTM